MCSVTGGSVTGGSVTECSMTGCSLCSLPPVELRVEGVQLLSNGGGGLGKLYLGWLPWSSDYNSHTNPATLPSHFP